MERPYRQILPEFANKPDSGNNFPHHNSLTHCIRWIYALAHSLLFQEPNGVE